MPRPQPPKDVPEGTVWFGGPIGWFSISLTFRADDLIPEDITRLFLVAPTKTRIKGQPLSKRTGVPVAKQGSWTVNLTLKETDEWDVSEAVRLLIGRFSQAYGAWESLPANAEACLLIGLHLETENQGFSLPTDILKFCADRNIRIDFDIYR